MAHGEYNISSNEGLLQRNEPGNRDASRCYDLRCLAIDPSAAFLVAWDAAAANAWCRFAHRRSVITPQNWSSSGIGVVPRRRDTCIDGALDPSTGSRSFALGSPRRSLPVYEELSRLAVVELVDRGSAAPEALERQPLMPDQTSPSIAWRSALPGSGRLSMTRSHGSAPCKRSKIIDSVRCPENHARHRSASDSGRHDIG